MKRLVALLAVAVAVAVLTRRLSTGRLHGTPDHWPDVPRRP